MLGYYRFPVYSLVVELVEIRHNLELVKAMLRVGWLRMLHHPAHLIVILWLWLLCLARRALFIFLRIALAVLFAAPTIVVIHSLLALAII
jgi:hypothetical protein